MSDGTSSSILLSAPSPSASTIGFPSPRPDSPSASTFLRTAATLDGLARQLGDINDEEPEEALRCCCGALVGEGMGGTCAMMKERDRMEDRMKLSGGESRPTIPFESRLGITAMATGLHVDSCRTDQQSILSS